MASSRLLFFLTLWSLSAVGCATTQKADKESRAPKRPLPGRGEAIRAEAPRSEPSRIDFSRADLPDPMAIATYSTSRQISMYYRLDLQRDNHHSPAMAEVMHVYDAPVRACYVERLEAKPGLKGDVDLSFALSKQSGGLEKIKYVGGSIKDAALVKCLKKRLAEIPFQPPRDMKGKLNYRFDATAYGATRVTTNRAGDR